MKQASKIILLLGLILIVSACSFSSKFKVEEKQPAMKAKPGVVATINSDIIVTTPASNQAITSPLVISGRARVFEATVSFRLKDFWENIIAEGFTTASQGAPEWGTYNTELEFKKSSSPTGYLEVFNQSAKDGSDQNLVRIPINFKDYKRQTVKVFFNNLEGDPNLIYCSRVYPVEREIEFSPNPMIASIVELLKGLSETDEKNGFMTSIPEEGVEVNKLEVEDGIVYIDFNESLQKDIAGSCRVLAIRAQIEETLKQFDGIEDVIISIAGESGSILQP